jgi:hypothetical protein
MRHIYLALALFISAITVSFAPAHAAEAKQNFTIVNKTGYEIKSVYVSPNKSDDWEEDVLGRDAMADGDSWDISFHRSEKTCHWDLKVVYTDDDSSAVWNNIDLCTIGKITIKYNRKSNTTSAVFD